MKERPKIEPVKSAVTDTGTTVEHDQVNKAGISNLLELFSFFSGRTIDSLVEEYGTGGYGRFKLAVGEAIVNGLRPIQERYRGMSHTDVSEVMERSAAIARDRAEQEMKTVREKVGLN